MIPLGVATIGKWDFNKCSALMLVVIPSGVMTIGEYFIKRCNRLNFLYWFTLKSVVIPLVVIMIGKYAFL